MPPWDSSLLLLLVPALMCGSFIILNLFTWPRGKTGGSLAGTLAVLIPARNEESHIETCVRRIYQNTVMPDEVIVCNDHSVDQTGAILAKLQQEFRTLKVIEGRDLPPDWIGKPHACMQLAAVSKCDNFLFVDADTYLQPTGIERMLSLFSMRGPTSQQASVVTAVPRQCTGSFFEHLILPLLHLTYTAWLWIPLIWKSKDPRFMAANGQLLAIKRQALQDIGGFEAIRSEIVDDMALCRLAKTKGHTVIFADGNKMATCRMYTSFKDVWMGFSKNLYEGIGSTPIALAIVIGLYLAVFLGPFLALPYSLVIGDSELLNVSLVGVALIYSLRVILGVRFLQSWVGVLLHPIAVLFFFMIAVNSFRWTASDKIEWSGRLYMARAKRRNS